jgi:hypothetical protein
MIELETRGELENHWLRLNRLKEQGHDFGNIPDEVFQRLVELVDEDDAKRLEQVRQDLQELFGEDVQIG